MAIKFVFVTISNYIDRNKINIFIFFCFTKRGGCNMQLKAKNHDIIEMKKNIFVLFCSTIKKWL